MIVHAFNPQGIYSGVPYMTLKIPVRIEIPVEKCVGTNGDKIIILDAEDSLDIIIERMEPEVSQIPLRECIYSWVKEPEL